ncbi:DUF2634 domain-containing protein [Ectobacillus ponti]|uniref:DUF2634 domain-containing protein n=1 Tax=Ectobacillus ponti TaxID=2961894 RepID=A0AA41X6X2_9BACI|nr:DUF2634 domain-containing protein [Ectobacillus ponti]MCP8970049.1 DUF2634 domain-containing protein [Ectobacillus ponti]
MALSPFKRTEERITAVQPKTAPYRTYKLNFDTGELEEGRIDGQEALIQFAQKALVTPRFRHLIYDDQYGCELEDLLGQDIPYALLESEISRLIREALIYDDRVVNVKDFVIRREGNQVFAAFTVVTQEGALVQEVML